jgi:hypothetical protein
MFICFLLAVSPVAVALISFVSNSNKPRSLKSLFDDARTQLTRAKVRSDPGGGERRRPGLNLFALVAHLGRVLIWS